MADKNYQVVGNSINVDSVRSYLKRNFFWGDYYNTPLRSIAFGMTFSDSTVYLTDFDNTQKGSWYIEQTETSTLVKMTFNFSIAPQIRTLVLDIKQNPNGTIYFDFYLSQTGFHYFKGPFVKNTPAQPISNSGWSANQSPVYKGYEYVFGNETDSTFTLNLPGDTLAGKYYYDAHSRNMVRVNLDNGGKLFLRKNANDHCVSAEDLYNTSVPTSKGIVRKYQGPQ